MICRSVCEPVPALFSVRSPMGHRSFRQDRRAFCPEGALRARNGSISEGRAELGSRQERFSPPVQRIASMSITGESTGPTIDD